MTVISLVQEEAEVVKCLLYKFLQFLRYCSCTSANASLNLKADYCVMYHYNLSFQNRIRIELKQIFIAICFNLVLSFFRAIIILLVFQLLYNADVVNGSWIRVLNLQNTINILSSFGITF